MPDSSTTTSALTYPFKLPKLDYAEDALSPVITQDTLRLHYGKHHQAYVDNLNNALKDYPDLQRLTLQELLVGLTLVPDAIRETVRNNAGGHANHSMYWSIMAAPDDKRAPTDELAAAISRDFGSLDTLKERLNDSGKKLFGSGWVFVTVNADGTLALINKPNQDTPLMTSGNVLIGNDVWEHAYYLTYQNRRVDYLKDWWSLVNWDAVAARYGRILKGEMVI